MELNFIFSSFRDVFVSELHIQGQKWLFTHSYSQGVRRKKVNKILYDKYSSMLAIRDYHVNNYFNDKFVFLCHVGYFINGDGWKLNIFIIFFIFLRNKFYIFIFQGYICQANF